MDDLTGDTHSRHGSLVPPDPNLGGRQRGPLVLLLVGTVACVAVFELRDRLRPARAEADSPRRTIVSPAPAIRPSARRPSAQPTSTAWVDPFGMAADQPAAAAGPRPPPVDRADASDPLRLQSVVIGGRTRTCLINGRTYGIGDDVGGAVVRAIGRDGVTISRGGRDERLTLPASHAAAGGAIRSR